MNLRNIQINFLVSIFILLLFPFSISANSSTIFAPTICPADIDLFVHTQEEINSRVEGVSANNTTKKIFNTQNHTSSIYERNPDVWTNLGNVQIDLTGISPWNSTGGATRAGTLITPRHIIFARHYQINTGATVRFVDNNNQVITRTLIAKIDTPLRDDITVGLLDVDVPETITHYPILDFNILKKFVPSNLKGIPLLILDQEEKALISDIGAVGTNISLEGVTRLMYHYQAPVGTDRNLFYETLIGGDSGNPGFMIIDGKPILMLTHWGPTTGPSFSHHIQQINNAVIALGGGYQLSTYDLSCFNNPPTIVEPNSNQIFTIDNTITTDDVITTVSATDMNDDSIQYSIVGGNADNVFQINQSTGELKVSSLEGINFQEEPFYQITVRVTDDSLSPLYAEITFLIYVEDNTEYPPYILTTELDVNEFVTHGDLVGEIAYIYKDMTQGAVSFELVQGGEDFIINSAGQIFIKSGKTLDYETQDTYDLEIKITGDNTLSTNSNVIINVTDSIEPPVSIVDSSFIIQEDKIGPIEIGEIEFNSDALPVQFSLESPHDLFEISSNGVVSLKSGQVITLGQNNPIILDAVVIDKNQIIVSFEIEILVSEKIRRSGGGGGGGSSARTNSAELQTPSTPATLPTTIEGLRVLLSQLQAQLAQLLSQIPSQLPSQSNTPFARDLETNTQGEDVRQLQQLLISKGYTIPAGSTGYFGEQTRQALIRFQQANNIQPASGYFGPVTRGRIME